MQKVRWGLLSTANINKMLIPALRASEHGELVAVASRSVKKAQAYAREWEIPRAFGSYAELLDPDHVDAVYISLPNHLHAEWSIKAMQAGIHVLCEKPLAITLTETKAMLQTSRETGRRLAEAFMYRHHPQTHLVKDWVTEGRLGEITLIRGAFDFLLPDSQRQPDALNVRLVPEYGGGCLWDVGVYPLSYAQYLMGETPERVMGWEWRGASGVDESFSAMLLYSDGKVAQISSSFRTPYHTFLEVIGSEGRLYVPRPFTNVHETQKMLFTGKDGSQQEVSLPQKSLYLGEVEDMNRAILAGAENELSPEESLGHVQTVLALYESAQKGRVISL